MSREWGLSTRVGEGEGTVPEGMAFELSDCVHLFVNGCNMPRVCFCVRGLCTVFVLPCRAASSLPLL